VVHYRGDRTCTRCVRAPSSAPMVRGRPSPSNACRGGSNALRGGLSRDHPRAADGKRSVRRHPLRCVLPGPTVSGFLCVIFPHGETASVGVGTACKGFSLRGATTELRALANLSGVETLRREGAPIPMKPCGAGTTGATWCLPATPPAWWRPHRGRYLLRHGGRPIGGRGRGSTARDGRRPRTAGGAAAVHEGSRDGVLGAGIMQRFWYSTDKRRERFVHICRDADVQR